MKEISTPSVQSFSGHTSEVSNLPTESGVYDGITFNAADGSTFIDIDTGDVYMFIDSGWSKM